MSRQGGREWESTSECCANVIWGKMVDQQSSSKSTDRKKTGLDLENYGYRKPTLGTYNRGVWDRIQIRLPLLERLLPQSYWTLVPSDPAPYRAPLPQLSTPNCCSEWWGLENPAIAICCGMGYITLEEDGKKYCWSILLGNQSLTLQAEALSGLRECTRDWTRATSQYLHHMVLQRFRSAGYTVLQTNSQGWWDTADGDCQLSGPNWFAIPSAEICLLGLYQALNWIWETLQIPIRTMNSACIINICFPCHSWFYQALSTSMLVSNRHCPFHPSLVQRLPGHEG